MLTCAISRNHKITMAKPNHLSVSSKISYVLFGYLGKLIATKKIKDTLLSFFFSREYKEIALCNISALAKALIPFLIQNNIKVKYIIDNSVKDNFLGCRAYRKNRWDIPSVDAIIVLPPNKTKHRNTIIRKTIEELDKYASCPIYSVFDLFKPSAPIKNIKKNYMFYRDLDPQYYAQELCAWFIKRTGKEFDLDHPRTFNEKMQWLKLNDNLDLKTKLSDKYAVRDWIKEKIGDKYLIPLLGVYESPYEIDYEALPNEFVIKCNHGSGMNIVVNDKTTLDKETAANKLGMWLSQNYAFRHGAGLELNYKNIKPKIIIEKKMVNEGHDELFDYKFWCFNGSAKYVQFVLDRFHGGVKHIVYDMNWNKQPFAYNHSMTDKTIAKPDNLELMIELAQKLSAGFKFVRVDFYRLNDGTVYFGEMTFYPEIGIGKWYGKDMDNEFGDLLAI